MGTEGLRRSSGQLFIFFKNECFIYFCQTVRLVGSYFPDQELDLGPQQ